jgi:hypothetical protein
MTGYMVRGEDPRVSDNYTILGVYLTDPLRDNNMVGALVSYWAWQNGTYHLRFTPYYYLDSPWSDPIDGRIGNFEWWGMWVIIDAVR